MTNEILGPVLAGVIPLVILGMSKLAGNWLRTEWLPQDRIEKGYRERERLLAMAAQLSADGQAAWADEWRRNAHAAALRPLAAMEIARERRVRSLIIVIVAEAYAIFVMLGLLSRAWPILRYPALVAVLVFIVGIVYLVGSAQRVSKEIRRRIEEKLVRKACVDLRADRVRTTPHRVDLRSTSEAV